MKSTDGDADRLDQPVSGRAHRDAAARIPVDDPFTRFDELMTVVEALCPVWPPRPAFDASAVYRL